MLLADNAGSGKSTAAINYDKENTLIPTPFNKLAIEFKKVGYNAITFNKLLGISVDETKKMKSYDIKKIKVIIRDTSMIIEVIKLLTEILYALSAAKAKKPTAMG